MKNTVFYLGVGLLFTHELDAMSNHEWLVLPLLSGLPQEYGKLVFVLAHIPVFAGVVALLSSSNESVRSKTRFGLSAFLVVHGVLHAAFIAHENYQFSSLLSNLLIFGAALCGLAYLILNRNHSSA